MTGRLSVITRKGQVTIPVEMRRALDLNEGDRVEISLEEDGVKLRRSGESVVARTAGIIPAAGVPAMSAEEERRFIEEAIAEDVVERMGA